MSYIQYMCILDELLRAKGAPSLFNGLSFRYIYVYIFQVVRRSINVLNVLCVSKYLSKVIFLLM